MASWFRPSQYSDFILCIELWFFGHKERSSLSLECDSCKLGKSKTFSFPLHASRASRYFDLIHSDVWGPSLVSSNEIFKYYTTFINDHSIFT